MVNQGVGVEPLGPKPQIPRERQQRVVMVNRNKDVIEVIHHIRRDDMMADNKLAVMVEPWSKESWHEMG